ncbi:MAG: hypothetical protein KJZ54_05360 [Phycisphaerales bacterium]|nr:hypothetical protein [Phycisphaerales bacterium]
MTSWPADTDPLDRAIINLLRSLPETWREHDKAGLTATEETALRLMERAGLVELRTTLRATMDGQPETVEMVVIISGEGARRKLLELLAGTVPHWVDDDGRTRGETLIEVADLQIRLSAKGANALHEYENQTPDHPSEVCSFVRRLGFFAHRPAVTPTVRVVSERVETRPAASQSPTGSASAAAEARVGAITINNFIGLDESEVASRILEKIGNQGLRGGTGSAAPPGDDASVGDGAGATESGDGALRPDADTVSSSPQPAGQPLPTSGMFTATDLAERFGVPIHALRKRLERWRAENLFGKGWVEDGSPESRNAKYLYDVSAVRPIIDALLASTGASIDRPSSKESPRQMPET